MQQQRHDTADGFGHARSSFGCRRFPPWATTVASSTAVVVVLLTVVWQSAPAGQLSGDDQQLMSLQSPSDTVDATDISNECDASLVVAQPTPSRSPTDSTDPSSAPVVATPYKPIPALGGVCLPLFPVNHVAYVIAYDLSEGTDQLSLRNAQFIRVFQGLRDAGCEVCAAPHHLHLAVPPSAYAAPHHLPPPSAYAAPHHLHLAVPLSAHAALLPPPAQLPHACT
jgi:hypothetical protein